MASTAHSWAKVAASIAENGQAILPQQQSEEQDWPLIIKPAISPSSVRTDQNTALRDQLMTATLALEQERLRANECFNRLKHYESKLSRTESQLDIARKKLVSLQPPQDVSDEQVKRAFDDLCQNIEDWVDINCEDLIELEQELSKPGWSDKEMRLLERHVTEGDIKLSGEFPKITANIIMSAIFSFVHDHSLRDERWFVGGSCKNEEFLNSVVETMAKKPSVDNIPTSSEYLAGLKFINSPQLRRWRSETFKALQGGKDYVHQRGTGLDHLAKDLSYILKHFSKEPPGRVQHAMRDKVNEAAEMLGDLIKASNDGYRFNFVVNSSSINAEVDIAEAQKYRLVNATTGAEEDLVENIDGLAGRLKLCVFPALEKQQDQGDRLQLSKALVVLQKASEFVKVPVQVDVGVAGPVASASDNVVVNGSHQVIDFEPEPKALNDTHDKAVSDQVGDIGKEQQSKGEWFSVQVQSQQHAGIQW